MVKLTEKDIMYSMFKFNETEHRKLVKFQKKHLTKCSSSSFKVKFSATGIGTYIEIECLKCNKTKDVSDYDCW